jgi:hypothetical protein
VNNPFNVEKNDEHVLDFAFHLFRLVLSVQNRACHLSTFVLLMFSFPERLSNHYQGLHRTFPRLAQHLMHSRCRTHREIVSGHIHDSK